MSNLRSRSCRQKYRRDENKNADNGPEIPLKHVRKKNHFP